MTKGEYYRESENNVIKVVILVLLAILADSGLPALVFRAFRNPRFRQIPRDSDSRDPRTGLFLGRNRSFRSKVVIPGHSRDSSSRTHSWDVFAIFLLSHRPSSAPLLLTFAHFCTLLSTFWTTLCHLLDHPVLPGPCTTLPGTPCTIPTLGTPLLYMPDCTATLRCMDERRVLWAQRPP